MVRAVADVVPVPYAEIVASISSKSAGPGTRANIDEFTETTAAALEVVGGADKGKAIIILNPVEPPLMMRNSVFCAIPAEAGEAGEVQDRILASIHAMVEKVQDYVPGYHRRAEPQFDPARATWGGQARVFVPIEVKGRGDYLPDYAATSTSSPRPRPGRRHDGRPPPRREHELEASTDLGRPRPAGRRVR